MILNALMLKNKGRAEKNYILLPNSSTLISIKFFKSSMRIKRLNRQILITKIVKDLFFENNKYAKAL